MFLVRMNVEEGLKRKAVTADKAPQGLAESLDRYLKNHGVLASLSPNEKTLVGKPVGSWAMQDIVNTSWRAEALGSILWALTQFESLPPYDTPFVLPEILGKLGNPDDFPNRTTLRTPIELSKARNAAELWHWRARTAVVQRRGVAPPPGLTFPGIIAQSAKMAFQERLIPQPIDNDFPFSGKPYSKLSDAEYQNAASIAQERHFAFNWLCGYSANWDETSTST